MDEPTTMPKNFGCHKQAASGYYKRPEQHESSICSSFNAPVHVLQF